jgi:hypothetical protein
MFPNLHIALQIYLTLHSCSAAEIAFSKLERKKNNYYSMYLNTRNLNFLMILTSENDVFESIEVLINDTIKKLARKNVFKHIE